EAARSAREHLRADESVLHAREFAFGKLRVRAEEGVGDDEAEHGVADEFERLVVERAGLLLLARAHALVRPRAVRERALKEASVVESIVEFLFERGDVRRVRVVLLRHARDCNKKRRARRPTFLEGSPRARCKAT